MCDSYFQTRVVINSVLLCIHDARHFITNKLVSWCLLYTISTRFPIWCSPDPSYITITYMPQNHKFLPSININLQSYQAQCITVSHAGNFQFWQQEFYLFTKKIHYAISLYLAFMHVFIVNDAACHPGGCIAWGNYHVISYQWENKKA